MKNPYFYEIRIQIQQILSEKLRHDANSFRLALWFAIHRFNKNTGTCAVTDEVLAAVFRQSTDTIARTVRKLSESGLFSVKRGRTGKATEYKLTGKVWTQAISLKQGARLRGAKVDNAGKYAGSDTANLRSQTLQESGPSLEKEEKDKSANSSELTGWGAFGGDGYHLIISFFGNQFKRTLEDLGYKIELTEFPFREGPDGRVFWMPKSSLPCCTSPMRLPYQQLLAATLAQLGLPKTNAT